MSKIGMLLMLGGAWCSLALAQPQVIDDFTVADAWQVIPSDGVQGAVRAVSGSDGNALHLDFDFTRGSGYCVVRRTVDLPLDANYRFRVAVRGQTAPNTLEFKLVAPGDQDVWWNVRREFDFPTDWTTLTIPKRSISFAWGPSGGTPLTRIAALELVVTAASGGAGWVEVSNLTYEALPVAAPLPTTCTATVSSRAHGAPDAPLQIGADGVVDWTSAASDAAPTITFDLGVAAELGGLRLGWADGHAPRAYVVAVGNDPATLDSLAETVAGVSGADYVLLPAAEGRYVQVRVTRPARNVAALRAVRFFGPEFAESGNARYAQIASAAPRGWYPRMFLDLQTPWTVVGVPADDNEVLFDEVGAVEADRRGYRVEPFVYADGRLISWANVDATPSLLDEYLPIPHVRWETVGVQLEIEPLAHGTSGASAVTVRYRVTNTGQTPQSVTLFLALRPFQVLPPWQNLGTVGGVARVTAIQRVGAAVQLAGQHPLLLETEPTAFGATNWAAGDVVQWLANGTVPPQAETTDTTGQASAALAYTWELAPRESHEAYVTIPLHEAAAPFGAKRNEASAAARFEQLRDTMRDLWVAELNRTPLKLPAAAQPVANTYRTAQAHILINADGPAIQPGSRTYERSWIRDGALTSTALLYTGHPERVRAFIEWYVPYQYDDGKVPCVVDRRGPDPVSEHDSTGEMLYLLARYYAFTHDRTPLDKFYPNVVAGVDYLEKLRDTRRTAEYQDGTDEQRAFYGLVPESISHEGYCAKPMHSYWDGFWTIRGYRDAATIAEVVGKPADAARFAKLRDDARTCMYDSMRLAMRLRGVDYIPGCVELGDFDATSTAIGVSPCDEQAFIPQPALARTFEKYMEFFRARRNDNIEWANYTPYELRIMGTLVRLGQPAAAHELLAFFFADQTPRAWNQWGEVVWHNHDTPKFIGDYPHTWVASEFLRSLRTMFVYEPEDDGTVVLAAGIDPAWLQDGGFAVQSWPTLYGPLSYEAQRDGATVRLKLAAKTLPPKGFVIRLGYLGPIQTARVNGQPVATASNGDIAVSQTPADVEIEFRE